MIAARRPYSAGDYAATFVSLAGYSMPVFWLGQIMLIVFALHLAWFPTQGMYSLRAPSQGLGRILDVAHHLVLPAITYSFYHLALIYRLTRVKMQEVMALDFITTARAKGVAEGRVVYRHALRNAILPGGDGDRAQLRFHARRLSADGDGVRLARHGPPAVRGHRRARLPRADGALLVLSVMVICANVLTDVIYALIDPRVVYR